MKKGFSLLEVIISMGMAVLIISSLVSVVTLAIRNAAFARNQTLATKFAQEGLEKVRSYRDQNSWANFLINCGNLISLGIISSTPATGFSRTVSCADPGDLNKRIITLRVTWTDAAGTHQSQLTSYFTNRALWK